MAQVRQNTGPEKGRLLFEGPVEDCKKWLADHFPHHHVNPPGSSDESQPDAVLSGEDEEE